MRKFIAEPNSAFEWPCFLYSLHSWQNFKNTTDFFRRIEASITFSSWVSRRNSPVWFRKRWVIQSSWFRISVPCRNIYINICKVKKSALVENSMKKITLFDIPQWFLSFHLQTSLCKRYFEKRDFIPAGWKSYIICSKFWMVNFSSLY